MKMFVLMLFVVAKAGQNVNDHPKGSTYLSRQIY